jgi:hypothetical protein
VRRPGRLHRRLPPGCLKIIEREAEEFDEAAVENHLESGDGYRREEDHALRLPVHPDPELCTGSRLPERQHAQDPRKNRFRPVPLAGPDPPDPAYGTVSERRRSAGDRRLCAGGLSLAAPGFSGRQDRDGGLPQISTTSRNMWTNFAEIFKVADVKSVTTSSWRCPAAPDCP